MVVRTRGRQYSVGASGTQVARTFSLELSKTSLTSPDDWFSGAHLRGVVPGELRGFLNRSLRSQHPPLAGPQNVRSERRPDALLQELEISTVRSSSSASVRSLTPPRTSAPIVSLATRTICAVLVSKAELQARDGIAESGAVVYRAAADRGSHRSFLTRSLVSSPTRFFGRSDRRVGVAVDADAGFSERPPRTREGPRAGKWSKCRVVLLGSGSGGAYASCRTEGCVVAGS